jgi:hypothetical protein
MQYRLLAIVGALLAATPASFGTSFIERFDLRSGKSRCADTIGRNVR